MQGIAPLIFKIEKERAILNHLVSSAIKNKTSLNDNSILIQSMKLDRLITKFLESVKIRLCIKRHFSKPKLEHQLTLIKSAEKRRSIYEKLR